MIDMEQLKFIQMLNELAERTKRGFIPFSECTPLMTDMSDVVFYDDFGVIPSPEGYRVYNVVDGFCVANGSIGIASVYSDRMVNAFVQAYIPSGADAEPYIRVSFPWPSDEEVVVSRGHWRVVDVES